MTILQPIDPVGDQVLRLHQLVTLGGAQSILGMMERFAAQVESFLDAEAEQGWPEQIVHRTIGAAAMLGFAQMEEAWRVMEEPTATLADTCAAVSAGRAAVRFARSWRP